MATSDVTRSLSDLVELASERLGGQVLAASDEFFAEKENLLRTAKPTFDEHRYTDRGKWMDGWETRRAFGRIEGHEFDWCIVELGAPGVIAGVDVDTSFFRGNFPESCAIEACDVRGDPSVSTLLAPSTIWREIVPRTKLKSDSSNPISVAPIDEYGLVKGQVVTHLRLKIFPDGGVARLRVFGRVVPDWASIRRFGSRVDLALVEHGGEVVACNDMFFGSRHNLIMPGRSTYMGDGWETKRKRAAGSDWAIVRLGLRAPRIHVVEVDTNWFKGNCPESCMLEVLDPVGAEGLKLASVLQSNDWRPLVPRSKLGPHSRHFFDVDAATPSCGSFVRLSIFPDGGISRLRVFADLPGPHE